MSGVLQSNEELHQGGTRESAFGANRPQVAVQRESFTVDLWQVKYQRKDVVRLRSQLIFFFEGVHWVKLRPAGQRFNPRPELLPDFKFFVTS
jgi:hypothetical protein